MSITTFCIACGRPAVPVADQTCLCHACHTSFTVRRLPSAVSAPAPSPRPHRLQRYLLAVFCLLVLGIAVVVVQGVRAAIAGDEQIHCSNRLQNIALAIRAYAEAHQGALPDTLADLPLSEDFTPDLLMCDEADTNVATSGGWGKTFTEPGHISYVYSGRGMNLYTTPGDAVMIYEPGPRHRGCLHLLHLDASVECLPRAEAIRKLQRTEDERTWDPQPTTHPSPIANP